MNIRKFEAGSFEEALNRVKTELGPDALILASEQKRNGWFQKPTVEITAAFEPPPEKEEWDDSALEKIFPHRRRTTAAEVHLEAEQERKPAPRETPQPTLNTTPSLSRVPQASTVERSLLDLGLSTETARDFTRQILFEFPKKDREDVAFLEKIQGKLISGGVKTLSSDVFQSRRCWAAVGGPGAGKTTVLVKLALLLKGQNQGVALSSCDNRKIIGRHEMAAYAKLVGVPFQTGIRPERKADHVSLLDTPSLAPSNADLFKEVEKSCRDASTVIVLDASQRLSELLATVDRFSRFAPVALTFTRLDVVSQAGVIHDVLKQTKLPLLGLSVSAGFSTPFRFFEPATLARFLVRRNRDEQAQRDLIETAAEKALESAI